MTLQKTRNYSLGKLVVALSALYVLLIASFADAATTLGSFGVSTDVPVAGDWNGNRASKIGTFRQGKWYLDNGDAKWVSGTDILVNNFGQKNDTPVSGDWNGDGITDLGAFRGGKWYLDSDGARGWSGSDTTISSFGVSGDLPVAGDWNGDGKSDVGVFRAGKWYIDGNGNRGWDSADNAAVFTFGQAGDIPVSGDWNSDGIADAGVFRAGKWYLDSNGNRAWDSGDIAVITFGQAGDRPVTGDWNGDGKIELGLFRQGIWMAEPVSIASQPVVDTTAPTVSILSPASGANYTSAQTVTVSVSAQDNVGVAKVELYDGSTLLSTDSVAPYSFAWAMSSSDNGSHSFTAKAYDAAGNGSISSAVALTVNVPIPDTSAPTVSITSPATGTTYTSAQTVTVSVAAQDNVGVAKVELYDGATLKGTDTIAPFNFSWVIASANNGSHSFTAKAYDTAGNSKVSAAAAFTVAIPLADTSAPTVSITSPVSGTTYTSAQTVTLSVVAQDNVGVTKVEFYDGSILKGVDTSFPYSYAWTISAADNGTHIFSCKAYDAADNSKTSTSTTLTVAIAAQGTGPLPVFPGAEGFGTETPAGRGGKIYKVTNLNDSGAGSLRAAVESTGARIIIFEVGGAIKLQSDLKVQNPFVTIAGQTAPFPGILIRDFGIKISTSDVLIQHIAVRVGDENKAATSQANIDNLDALQIVGGSRIVIDHVSLSWSIDECFSVWGTIKNVTISNSIISEALGYSLHTEQPHSMGFLIGRFVGPVTMARNLVAHNLGRNPWFQGGTSVVSANNVVYNGSGVFYTIGSADGPAYASIVGNTAILGPTQTRKEMIRLVTGSIAGTQIYQSDNFYEGYTIFRSDAGFDPLVSTPPVSLSNINIMGRENGKNYVFANAGSRPAQRDSVDQRIITDVKNRTGAHINSQMEVGGWPAYPTTFRSFNEGSDPSGDFDGDGYTNIEESLHVMAAEVEGRI